MVGVKGSQLTTLNLLFSSPLSKLIKIVHPLSPQGSVSAKAKTSLAKAFVKSVGSSTSPQAKCALLALFSSSANRFESASTAKASESTTTSLSVKKKFNQKKKARRSETLVAKRAREVTEGHPEFYFSLTSDVVVELVGK